MSRLSLLLTLLAVVAGFCQAAENRDKRQWLLRTGYGGAAYVSSSPVLAQAPAQANVVSGLISSSPLVSLGGTVTQTVAGTVGTVVQPVTTLTGTVLNLAGTATPLLIQVKNPVTQVVSGLPVVQTIVSPQVTGAVTPAATQLLTAISSTGQTVVPIVGGSVASLPIVGSVAAPITTALVNGQLVSFYNTLSATGNQIVVGVLSIPARQAILTSSPAPAVALAQPAAVQISSPTILTSSPAPAVALVQPAAVQVSNPSIITATPVPTLAAAPAALVQPATVQTVIQRQTVITQPKIQLLSAYQPVVSAYPTASIQLKKH